MQPVSITRRLRNEALTALIARAPLEFADVAGYAELTKGQRLQLFRALLKAKRHFDFRKNVKAIAKNTAADSLLNDYSNSIRRTADFGDLILDSLETDSDGKPVRRATELGEKARRWLDEAGERWARAQLEAGAELPNGFSPSDDFIENFLRSARIMHSIIEMAKAPPAKIGIKGRAANFQNSPAVWLAGDKLPEIYRRIFDRNFTATAKTDVADTSPGIKFVRAAYLALGLDPVDDETIRTHYRNARKGSSLGVG
jgi:hypothetical protein